MNAVVQSEKLAAVLGMLGSAHDGEALNAARLAERMRRQAGVTWQELLAAYQQERASSPPPERRPPDWRVMIGECQCRPDLLSEWERRFVRSLSCQSRLSCKQLAVLTKLAAKVRA